MKTVTTVHPGDFIETAGHNPVYQAYQPSALGFCHCPDPRWFRQILQQVDRLVYVPLVPAG
jgi:hypothetical protein